MGAPARLRTVIPSAVLLALTLLPACHQAEKIRAQALADSRLVDFQSIDGVSLSGRMFGPDAATSAVVLAHMEGSDQRAWFEFADRLGGLGYRVLTFDFRGNCPGGDGGCSKGTKNQTEIWNDVAGAVGLMHTQGARHLALVGAGMGGTASLVLASQAANGIAAVITLSAPASIGGLQAGPAALQTVTAAKLFIAGNGDPGGAQAAQAFYDESGQPKRVEILTTDDRGTDILDGNQGEVAGNLIVDWLARYLPVP
ncbi:MAG: alpha/beta hydrolase [Actinomycetota bacterium]